MKKQFKSFIAGVLATVLAGSLAISALAITERMTITVDPINVQVNGETFQPKDVNGKDVPVFVYEGTTYAPLRALAEAYGLEVGYDSEKNMATVIDPDAKPATTDVIPATPDTATSYNWSPEEEAAYQEFIESWKQILIEYDKEMDGSDRAVVLLEYNGSMDRDNLAAYLHNQINLDWYTRMLYGYVSDQNESVVILFYHTYQKYENAVATVALSPFTKTAQVI